jgi:predicted membrane-bound spermidine synthase
MSSQDTSSSYLQQMTSVAGTVASYMRVPVLVSSVLDSSACSFFLKFITDAHVPPLVHVLTMAAGHRCCIELPLVLQAKVSLSVLTPPCHPLWDNEI